MLTKRGSEEELKLSGDRGEGEGKRSVKGVYLG